MFYRSKMNTVASAQPKQNDFFCLCLHELNLLPQAMNNFIRDDKPFERLFPFVLFLYARFFFIFFASSISFRFVHSFSPTLWISTIIFHLLVFCSLCLLVSHNLLLSIVPSTRTVNKFFDVIFLFLPFGVLPFWLIQTGICFGSKCWFITCMMYFHHFGIGLIDLPQIIKRFLNACLHVSVLAPCQILTISNGKMWSEYVSQMNWNQSSQRYLQSVEYGWKLFNWSLNLKIQRSKKNNSNTTFLIRTGELFSFIFFRYISGKKTTNFQGPNSL